ncbi:MAG: hypothetical protein L3J04_06265 [Robiginitomaculum sp.]|nr:hypothetical protein [Robiginitomaculum sp.]
MTEKRTRLIMITLIKWLAITSVVSFALFLNKPVEAVILFSIGLLGISPQSRRSLANIYSVIRREAKKISPNLKDNAEDKE